ncbi:MAG: hypothetical protein GXO26_08365 [Crenarchaeota archaeon]|nr:hypothetical protein [Thermoproteota archaeon]
MRSRIKIKIGTLAGGVTAAVAVSALTGNIAYLIIISAITGIALALLDWKR